MKSEEKENSVVSIWENAEKTVQKPFDCHGPLHVGVSLKVDIPFFCDSFFTREFVITSVDRHKKELSLQLVEKEKK